MNPLGFPLDVKVNSQTAEFNILGVSSPVAGVAPWRTLRGSMVLPPRRRPRRGRWRPGGRGAAHVEQLAVEWVARRA